MKSGGPRVVHDAGRHSPHSATASQPSRRSVSKDLSELWSPVQHPDAMTSLAPLSFPPRNRLCPHRMHYPHLAGAMAGTASSYHKSSALPQSCRSSADASQSIKLHPAWFVQAPDTLCHTPPSSVALHPNPFKSVLYVHPHLPLQWAHHICSPGTLCLLWIRVYQLIRRLPSSTLVRWFAPETFKLKTN